MFTRNTQASSYALVVLKVFSFTQYQNNAKTQFENFRRINLHRLSDHWIYSLLLLPYHWALGCEIAVRKKVSSPFNDWVPASISLNLILFDVSIFLLVCYWLYVFQKEDHFSLKIFYKTFEKTSSQKIDKRKRGPITLNILKQLQSMVR